MYSELCFLIITFGLLVLLTYAEALRSNNNKLLWGGLPRSTCNPWVISMLLTVVSFLYMSGMWVWNEDLIIYTTPYKDIRHIVLFQYILFLAGAVLWAPLTLIALRREQKLYSVLLALWLTASGSIGLFVMACGTQDLLMIIAATICMLHHVIFDAIYWWFTWDVGSRGSSKTKKVDDRTLQFI